MELLASKIHRLWKVGGASYHEKDYIKSNLNPNFTARKYQKECIGKFDFYLNQYSVLQNQAPIHLLLNMATGSGKTFLMAANMLELYTKGYHNFIFIVNNTNIIKKTIANFTNAGNSKYLFADKIIFDSKEIQINQVTNFETVHNDDINILFSTIQSLHTKLKEPQEGAITFETLQQTKLVVLSDEAHHLNSLTKKKKNKSEIEQENNWEWTINAVINNHPQNILLEYTATIDLKHPEIAKKYADKVLMQYSLKEFRNDGYSKEIRLIKSNLSTNERILQALLLSQYRLKVANENNLHSPYLPFKPVILFKSPGIEASVATFSKFKLLIKNLKVSELINLRQNGGASLSKAFEYFKQLNVSLEQLTEEIKDAFREERCIIINNENDSEQKQMELNQLESAESEYRAIFTVKMLTEGWDVLNLFDIVRLDESNGLNAQRTVVASTVSEAQLIGRGARYFPFTKNAGDNMYQRKLDSDLDNDLRCLEELYYHSVSDNKYIDAITEELTRHGVYNTNLPEESFSKEKQPLFNKSKQVEKAGKTLTRTDKQSSFFSVLKNLQFEIPTGTAEIVVFNKDVLNADKSLLQQFVNDVAQNIKLIDLGLNICLKATELIPFFYFDNLKNIFPDLKSTRDFFTDKKGIGQTPISLSGSSYSLNSLSPIQKLNIAKNILKAIKNDFNLSNVN